MVSLEITLCKALLERWKLGELFLEESPYKTTQISGNWDTLRELVLEFVQEDLVWATNTYKKMQNGVH